MDIQNHCPTKLQFYGTATIGTKGQIVIPAKAREALSTYAGEQFIVFGLKDKGIIGICPLEKLEHIFTNMSQKLEDIQQVFEEAKNDKEKED